MTVQKNTNEIEQLKDLQKEIGAEYAVLSGDYWHTRKLLDVMRGIGWAALIVAVIVEIAYIFVGGSALIIAELVCNVWWVGTFIIADEMELSALRQWHLAMSKYVRRNMTDD